MKVLLVQLPVLSADLAYPAEHVPLGAASVAAYASVHVPEVTVELLPQDLCTWAGDAAIIEDILAREPDIVAFSCYLWNVERSCYIAEQLKLRGCKAITVAGGPEVSTDNTWITDKKVFDYFFVGEGEKSFAGFLSEVSKKSWPVKRIITSELLGPEELVSPYLTGFLKPAPSGSVLMESLRGCSYRCAYCFYHKSSGITRVLPLKRVVSELLWARNQGAGEVVFTDPSFLARPKVIEFLDVLKRYGRGLDLYVELNAEHCTEELVRGLKSSGVVQVEIGLQTVNDKALRAVGRTWNRKDFVAGVKRLRDAGITVTLDIIVGLPHDTLDDIIRSIDFATHNDLYDELNLYPLSILPGTELRNKAARFGILYMKEPPYYVIKTPWLDTEEISDAFSYAEEATGFDFFPVEIPYLGPATGEFISVIELEKEPTFPAPSRCSCVVSIIIRDPEWWKNVDSVKSFGQRLVESNPYVVLNWIVTGSLVPENNEVFASLRKLYIFRSHPLDREFFSARSAVNSCQIFITMNDPLLNNSNVWVWIPPPGNKASEFRITAENIDEKVAEEWGKALLRRLTGRINPDYRMGEAI